MSTVHFSSFNKFVQEWSVQELRSYLLFFDFLCVCVCVQENLHLKKPNDLKHKEVGFDLCGSKWCRTTGEKRKKFMQNFLAELWQEPNLLSEVIDIITQLLIWQLLIKLHTVKINL